jgi:hypothetical protein
MDNSVNRLLHYLIKSDLEHPAMRALKCLVEARIPMASVATFNLT